MFRKLASRRDWQIALTFTLVLRVIFSAIAAALSFLLHPDPRLIQSNVLTEHLPQPGTIYYALLGVWERFDTLWYLRIAQHGYDLPMAVTFYPLYPILIRLLSTVMPGIAAALVISTAAAFFVLWGLLRMAGGGAVEASSRRRVLTLLFFCAWPTSFILFAGYADAVTIALVIWAVIFAREERWPAATLFGLLAGAARPSGVLVFVPLALLALRSRQLKSLIVLLTPVGLMSYWGWLRVTGRPSVVTAYRLYYGSAMVPPWSGFAQCMRLIVGGHDALLAIKLGMVLAFAVIVLRSATLSKVGVADESDLRLEDRAFAVMVILQMMMYTGHPLLGGARYLLIVYPAFLAIGSYAAHWEKRKVAFYVAALFVSNLAWMWAFLNWSLVL